MKTPGLCKPSRQIDLSRWRLARMPGRAISPLNLLLATPTCHTQDIEPRRWSHLPPDANFLGVGHACTNGDISLNPVIQGSNAILNSSFSKSVAAGA